MYAMIFEVESSENISDVGNYTKCSPAATESGFLVCIQRSSLLLVTDENQAVLHTNHKLPITTLCVSSAAHPYICSCSDDKVIIWGLDDFCDTRSGAKDRSSSGLLVGIDLGAITDCSISCNNTWLALCRENDVWVVSLQHVNGVLNAVSHHATLEPAAEAPSFCCFSPVVPHLLITADDSNTFKIWNAEEGQLIQRSAVGGWHRISFCEFVLRGSYQGNLLVGTNRGALHLFSVESNKPPRDLGKVSAAPPAHHTVVVTPEFDDLKLGDNSLKSVSSGVDTEYLDQLAGRAPVTPPGGSDDICEAGCVVLGALLVDAEPRTSSTSTESPDSSNPGLPDGLLHPDEEDLSVSAIVAPAPLLVVCSNLGVAVHDCNSWDCVAFRPFAEMLGAEQELSLVSAATLTGRSPGQVHCLLSGWASCAARCAGPRTHLVRMALKPSSQPPPRISFLNLSSPSTRSPLRAQFSRPAVDAVTAAYGCKSKTGASSRASPKQGGGIESKTSTRTVRSSGYGAMPTNPRQRFIPVTNTPKRSIGGVRAGSGGGGEGGGRMLSRVDGELMRTWTPPLQQTTKVSLWNDFGTAVRLASSGDGTSLACSCGPGVLSVLRWSRPSVDDCVRIAGHDARITSLCFSADSAWLMSASSDGRTKVWDWRERRCALDIDEDLPSSGPGVRRGALGGAARTGPSTKKGRGHAVTQAGFFYLDRFILRAVSNTVELYCHRLHDQPDAPAVKLNVVRGWRRVRRIKFPTQQVMCFTAPNDFYSNILVAGCASRSLHVYDVDAERFVAEVRDAHPRPPHALGLATPSSVAPHSARAADLLVSASACDGTKLWDLRQVRCVQKFSRHLNRAHTCGSALSPCCRFLAVGSEDKCVYIYDTRKSSDYVDKLMGLNEVVLDIAWNSSRPQLAASALNSCVAVYSKI